MNSHTQHVTEPLLTAAHAVAACPKQRTREGVRFIRAALTSTADHLAHEDGWLWADEALREIEDGNNKPALWEKVADNLATLFPEMDGQDRPLTAHIDRCEAILSTPGVTIIAWDTYRPGENPLEHLAYLQRIAQQEGFSLQLPQPVGAHVRAINKTRGRASR